MLGFILQCLLLGGGFFFLGHYLAPEKRELPLEIINAHEHIQSSHEAQAYLVAAHAEGITHTVILGSPAAALKTGQRGYQGTDDNNRQMQGLSQRYPRDYSFFIALDPEDPLNLHKLEEALRHGARGVKLYSGHSAYHQNLVDEATLLPIFEYCEKNNVPMIMHVNPALYQSEFERVLQTYPRLKVVCPHYCLSTIRLDRFQKLMDRYPNLYTDTSFGFVEYFKSALIRFSENPQKYREFILRYQDRILFGLDLVINGEGYKDKRWFRQMIRAYRDVLEKEEFAFSELPEKTLRGLSLDRVVLRKIYYANFQRLVFKKSA